MDALPFTVVVPDSSSGAIEIFDQHAALKISIVDRANVHLLPDEWDTPGVYLLLDRHDHDGAWGCYVGKAPAGVRSRLGSHLRNKDHWYRAVLIRRDTTFGFNSAQVGWLEGRLYDMLKASEYAELHNGNRPSDETLPPYDRQMLEMVILPIRRVLALMGHDVASPDDTTVSVSKAKRSNRFYGIALIQIIDAGLLDVGTTLVSTNGVWPATCRVLAGGAIEYAGQTFPSPSAAACAVKNGPANGWDFWAVETSTGTVTLATLRSRLLDQSASGSTPVNPISE